MNERRDAMLVGQLHTSNCARCTQKARAVSTLVLALLGVSIPRVSFAEPPTNDREIVVTGTRTPEQSRRATVRTDIVSRDDIERRGATNVAEALASQPGVQVNPGAYANLGGVSAIQIQGFDKDRVLILEDGERVIGDMGGAIDLAAIPASDIDRIEIVPGPSSALYGSNAIGGVVNILTAPPAFGSTGRARIEGRSHRGLVLQGRASHRSRSAWVGADVDASRMDGIARTHGLPDLTVPEAHRQTFGLRAGVALSDCAEIRIRARWSQATTEGLETQDIPALGRFVVEQPSVADRKIVHLVQTLKLGKGSSLRSSLVWQGYEGQTQNKYQGSPVDETRRRDYSLRGLELTTTLADGPRTWVVGARVEAENFAQSLSKTTVVDSALSASRTEEVSPIGRSTLALYTQVGWKLSDQLTILPGIREEIHSRYGHATAPRFAVAFRADDSLTARASVGRGFRAPSAKELGFVFDHSSYGYKVEGSSSLEPETSWGINADLTWRPQKEITLRAGAFANWIDHLIDVDLASGVNQGGIATYQYRNFGRARTSGAQLSATFKISPRFRSELTYDYLWTRDDQQERPLAGRPPHTVTSSVVFAFLQRTELTVRWRATADAFVDDNVRSPAFTTLDARCSRELYGHSQAYVGVLNATDVHSQPGRLGDLRPPLGRVLYIGLRADFPLEEDP